MNEASDLNHLRHAIRLSEEARRQGNRPFGAVLVSESGEVLAATSNTTVTSRDLTAHAEMNALRAASGQVAPEILARATMYASGEPCPMCTGTMIRLSVPRVVFGIRESTAMPYMAGLNTVMANATSCRDFFKLAPSPVEVVGPLLEEEATIPFQAFASRGSN